MPEEVKTEGETKVTETQEVTKTEEAPKSKTYDEDYVKELRQESAKYRTNLRNVESERDKALAELEEARGGGKAAESRLGQLENENAKLRIALDKGLPKDLVPRLVGTNEEELAADAEALLALIGPQKSGIHDNGTRQKIEPPDLDTQILEAEKANNWTLARTLKTQKAFRLAND